MSTILLSKFLGFAKFHENRLKLKGDEVDRRMQQIQDECDRKIAEHKEKYQRLFQKKVNEVRKFCLISTEVQEELW